MSVDIRTRTIEPLRHTYDQVVRQTGADKPASRYLEGTMEVQPQVNFHYRPRWQPDREIYDPARTAIVMANWYAFRDPRQYYYTSWNIARARQQETAERNFQFVDKRAMLDILADADRERIVSGVLPLRHVAYAANLNNTQVAAMGYGTAFTQAASFTAMDQLGIAQYLTRIGLVMDGNTAETLARAKQAWMEDAELQPLRRLVEELLTVEDWFELWLAQNVALDGLQFPLVYERFEQAVSQRGGAAFAMLTEFMVEWYGDNARWVDAALKVAAAESDANRERLTAWLDRWLARAREALAPLAERLLDADGAAALEEGEAALRARLAKKAGLGTAQ